MTDQSVNITRKAMATVKHSETKQERRRQILESARNLFIQKPYQEMVMDEVARDAHVAKGTLYLYFKSKEDLLAGVLEEMMNQVDAAIHEEIQADMDAAEKIRRRIGIYLRFTDRNREFFFRYVTPDLVQAASQRSNKNHLQSHIATTSELIKEGVRRGCLPELNVTWATLSLLSLVRAAMLEKIHCRGDWDLESRSEQVFDMFVFGAKGRRD
ncbi:MAG: TetR/AcrR family transcriptional regulator [Verrucomicrobiae bacterium]|nr:TetR/AcrR family transcriptional regulator [Verrucomicrobiae bacterium]